MSENAVDKFLELSGLKDSPLLDDEVVEQIRHHVTAVPECPVEFKELTFDEFAESVSRPDGLPEFQLFADIMCLPGDDQRNEVIK